jgi:predicted small metal-binding protein
MHSTRLRIRGFTRTMSQESAGASIGLHGGKRRNPMKEFHCGSLVPGCDWHTRADEEAEVMRRAVEHMRETHGETVIRETMIEAIRSRIEKTRDAA